MPTRQPVGPDDLAVATTEAADALARVVDRDWSRRAGDLVWDCRYTAGHIADALLSYALQIAGGITDGWVSLSITAEPEATNEQLVRCIEAAGGVLVVVLSSSPETLAHHTFGLTDAEGFAAMGIAELLLHTLDITTGLDVAFRPSDDACTKVVDRLFPGLPAADEATPWQRLGWAMGRLELPDYPRQSSWRWRVAPLPVTTPDSDRY